VARDLLGARIVRREGGVDAVATIVETEAYQGEEDLACHARAGRTSRTRIMYGPGGFAYVYFTYGAHWMLNAVTDAVDTPAAVLIRAVQPVAGLDAILRRRPLPHQSKGQTGPQVKGWTDGPAKLCEALGIDGQFNGADLCDPLGSLLIAPGSPVAETRVIAGPRVGIQNVAEPWRSKPWRWRIIDR